MGNRGRPKSHIPRAEQLRLAQRKRHVKLMKKKKRLCVYVAEDALAEFHDTCHNRGKTYGEVLEDLFRKLDEFLSLDLNERLYWPRRALEEALYQFSVIEGYELYLDNKKYKYMDLKAVLERYVAYAERLLIEWDSEQEQRLLQPLKGAHYVRPKKPYRLRPKGAEKQLVFSGEISDETFLKLNAKYSR